MATDTIVLIKWKVLFKVLLFFAQKVPFQYFFFVSCSNFFIYFPFNLLTSGVKVHVNFIVIIVENFE